MDDVALTHSEESSLTSSGSDTDRSSAESVTESRLPDDDAVALSESRLDAISDDELSAADTQTADNPASEASSGEEELGQERLAQILEALLFASDAPLTASRLGQLAGGVGVTQVRLALAHLNDKYTAAGLSFRVESIARGYQLLTLPEYQTYLDQLNAQRSETRLTDATLETLAIVAYKQPIIRADVEALRGVGCGEVLNRLREMNLVRIVGRADVIGRPMLYGTTKKFLDVFGLADLDDLPPMEALKFRAATLSAKPAGESRSASDAPPIAAAGA